jgi:ABC-type tungstate transport system substrate-binding protein
MLDLPLLVLMTLLAACRRRGEFALAIALGFVLLLLAAAVNALLAWRPLAA